MLTRDGFDMIKVLKNYSAKSERRVFYDRDTENRTRIYGIIAFLNVKYHPPVPMA